MAPLSLRQSETVQEARGIVREVEDATKQFSVEQVGLQQRFVQDHGIARQNELHTSSIHQQFDLTADTARRVQDISHQIATDNATVRQHEQQTIFRINIKGI